MSKVPSFQSFIKNYYPWFAIDEINQPVIQKLGLWALRKQEFEDMRQGWYLEKGIFLGGPVGVGKTKLLGFMKDYLDFLRSPYRFQRKIVWHFAHDFKEVGIKCFSKEQSGNKFYDELCMTKDSTGKPEVEEVSHYGNKILIGSQLIMMRYEVFSDTGYQSHFATNTSMEEIKKHYGVREYDRLRDMCNFFFIEDESKRGGRPQFKTNILNEDASRHALMIAGDSARSQKIRINERYLRYLSTGEAEDNDGFDFSLLQSLGCSLGTDEDITGLKQIVLQQRAKAVRESTKPNDLHEDMTVERWRRIKAMHQDGGPFDKDENALLWMRVRMYAVMNFYRLMKEGGAQVIFSDV